MRLMRSSSFIGWLSSPLSWKPKPGDNTNYNLMEHDTTQHMCVGTNGTQHDKMIGEAETIVLGVRL